MGYTHPAKTFTMKLAKDGATLHLATIYCYKCSDDSFDAVDVVNDVAQTMTQKD